MVSLPPLFMDTNYLVALLDPRDSLHEVAQRKSHEMSNRRLVTTDFVLIEFLRLFAKRNTLHRQLAVATVKNVRDSKNIDVVPATRELFDLALVMYHCFKDKQWDLVDCSSFVVMEKFKIRSALTHDIHFEQMGFEALLR